MKSALFLLLLSSGHVFGNAEQHKDSRGWSLMSKIAVLALLLAGGGAAWRLLQDSEKKGLASFSKDLHEEIAKMICEKLGVSFDRIMEILEGEDQSKLLEVENLLKIELLFTKTSPSEVDVAIIVLIFADQKAVRLTTEKTCPWEELPSEIRRRFITESEKQISYSYFDRSDLSRRKI